MNAVTAKPAKLKGRKLEALHTEILKPIVNCVELDIFDIGKVCRAGENAYAAAATHDEGITAATEAYKAAVAKYRKN